MQHSSPNDAARKPALAASSTDRATVRRDRRAIDCGSASDDRSHRPRAERGDARHAYLTSRGTNAEQVQAV